MVEGWKTIINTSLQNTIQKKDQNRWILDFACDYIQTCLTQYISFLTRTSLHSAKEIWGHILIIAFNLA
jgi:hypothetical protein